MKEFASSRVAEVFAAYPPQIRKRLLFLRQLVFATAAATEGVGAVEETLKWGQPAYLTRESRSGSTIRIDCRKADPHTYAMYFHCQTDLVHRFRTLFPKIFAFEGNGALVFHENDEVPVRELEVCIAAALTYRRTRNLVLISINTMTYMYGICFPPVAPLVNREGVACRENARIASRCRHLSANGWKPWHADMRHRIEMLSAPGSFCTPRPAWTTRLLPHGWTRHGRSSASGASASSRNAGPAWRNDLAAGAPRSFPPSLVVAIKALACELPYESEVPLSRWSVPEIRREVIERGLVASIGETTLWRWLTEDAIRPWSHRSWIFPRDPDFECKAARVLDLYEGRWHGQALSPKDCVVCADEKTSIQARQRRHPTLPPQPSRAMRVEHEYKRMGAWTYLAAWDVRRARVHGRCEHRSGIAAFDRLVEQVMSQPPYRRAPRVFWIMDNGSAHRGVRCLARLRERWPNIIVVHAPSSSTRRSMPVGSTRWKFTSRSCNARRSLPMISAL